LWDNVVPQIFAGQSIDLFSPSTLILKSTSLIPVVDAIPLIIGVIDRSNRQGLTANFAYVAALDALLAALTSATVALESAEDDGGASANDTHCTDKPN
jgi:hypothetical protein